MHHIRLERPPSTVRLCRGRDKAAFLGAACQVWISHPEFYFLGRMIGFFLLFGSNDLPGDELLHDLVGAPVYGLHSGVGVCPSDAGLPHVSPPAVHLNALRGHGVLQLGGPVLDHGRGLKSWELV